MTIDNLKNSDDDLLWDTLEASKRIGVHPGTMEQWRMKGEGPPYVKIVQ